MDVCPDPLYVLVVDDEPDTATSLVDILAYYGHRARCCGHAEAALASAAADPPDVIVLDLRLPGMSGWELGRRLAAGPKPPLLIAVSGCTGEEDRRRSADAGIHLHLVKPVEPATIIGVLKRLARAVGPN